MTCECTATVHSSRLGVFFFLFLIKEDCYFSLFLHEIVGFGYSLEGPQRGASNEYPQPTFTWRNKKFNMWRLGWSGGAKVLCILHHWGVQLILAYSWARPAILVVGKGRGGMFLFLLFLHFHSCSSFFPVPLSSLSLSFISSTLFYLFSPFLWETTQNDPQGLTCR